jgi:hypothetical protein
MRLWLLVLPALACARSPAPPSEYLYLWTGSSDTTQPDFLAVLDVTESPLRYGTLVTTVPVPGHRNVPHHTEHEMPADRRLFANGFASGKTFIFDMTDAAAPRLDGQLGEVDGMLHPHSYIRLPNGNVLATFQMWHARAGPMPGGLAEITPQAKVVRSTSLNMPGIERGIRPYSAAVVPDLDRIVVTTTDMDKDDPASRTIEVWRLSDLKLLHSFKLPDGPAGNEGLLSAEPRVMADGRTVLVSTFNCGLYLIQGLDTDTTSARLVSSFPRLEGESCAIPVIAGHHYLVTVPALHAVVSLDISDPAAPREVSRATLDTTYVPHWISIAPDHRRVVVTGYGGMQHKVVLLKFDSANGQLEIDRKFRDAGTWRTGFRMDNKTWPHGGNAPGLPHGAVFSGRTGGRTD